MKVCFLIAFSLAAAAPAFCASPSILFDGSVQRDNAKPETFELAVDDGKKSQLTLLNGVVVEINVDGAANTTRIRLLDRNGAVLHVDSLTSADRSHESFRYRICGKAVTFVASATAIQACGKS